MTNSTTLTRRESFLVGVRSDLAEHSQVWCGGSGSKVGPEGPNFYIVRPLIPVD